MNDYIAKVIENVPIGDGGRKLTVCVNNPPTTIGGNFAMLSTGCGEMLLRRPLGIAEAQDDIFSFAYQIKGDGTRAFSRLSGGDAVKITMPLGNGFDMSDASRVAIVGGGYGVAPLLLTATQCVVQKRLYLGFSNARSAILTDEFSRYNARIFTDDGSLGEKGFPTAGLEADAEEFNPDLILCCGPEPLMRAVKRIGARLGVKTLLSLEQRMGCGVGACLVCTCRINNANKRVCADGPVFDATEVYE